MTYAAIATRWNGVNYRSRLEAKWAIFFTVLGWKFEYEALDLRSSSGGKIPDFLMTNFTQPTLIECKPAVTVDEIDAHRQRLREVARDWLRADAERELAELDATPEDDLERIDDLLQYLDEIERKDGRSCVPGRRVIVVGSQLFIGTPYTTDGSNNVDGVTFDGYHTIAMCPRGDHFGMLALYEGWNCVVCGSRVDSILPSSDALALWREAGNRSQWRPPK